VATQPPFTPRISPFTGILSSLHSNKHACCCNPILDYSSKIIFFQNKNQKNKIKANNVEKAGREIKLQFLEEIKDLIVPHYAPK
jgi:hypothetical protein